MPRRKRKEYAVALDTGDRVSTERGEPARFGDDWTPEHLVLAALARCVVTSLHHQLRRDGLQGAASAEATGAVFEREDGSWGFVEVACTVDVELPDPPEDAALADLLRRAERGCFVGASLDPRPRYAWRLNGADVSW